MSLIPKKNMNLMGSVGILIARSMDMLLIAKAHQATPLVNSKRVILWMTPLDTCISLVPTFKLMA
jgi:hypothetical protein